MSTLADTVLFNGRVLTVDPHDTVVESVAIKGGRILAVGTNEEIRPYIGEDTKVIELDGRAVTPGLVDSHNHTVEYGFSEMTLNLRYPGVKSIKEIQALIEASAKETPEGQWIKGIGWDEGLLDENRCIKRHDLDPVSPRHPVVLEAQSAFSVVNSYALRLAGVEPEEGGHDGVLTSGPVSLRIKAMAYDHSVKEIEEAILKAQQGLFSVGITAQKEAGASDDMIQAYRNLHDRGDLKIRSYVMIGIHNGRTSLKLAKDVVSQYKPWGDDVLAVRSVKCSFDGSGANRTAWLHEEWNRGFTDVDHGNYGGPIIDAPHTYPDIMKTLHGAGFQVGAHCIGDRTIEEYLEAVQSTILSDPKEDCRHSVIHCNLPTAKALRKLVELGDNVVVEATTAYMYFVGDIYSSNFGPSRSRCLIPMKTWKERGVIVGNGCDFNTCLVNPLFGLYAACTRKPMKGLNGPQPFGVDEQLTFQDALRSYTINSAHCMFWEKILGSIELGKYADLVVWSRDLDDTRPEELLKTEAELTFVAGEIVYSKSSELMLGSRKFPSPNPT
ncbi:MAG TPA: amidohydrolase family protein [Patescibacteria group bacterium]|nr:amidohydrolase family protein [Patescibacteria group bacterium]